MPVEVTYPGVYVQELPSNAHTIAGSPTSIAAFIGRALTGPVNNPVRITNFGQYQTLFGGLAADYPLSYAVQQFFENGGSEAVIVRLFRPISDDAQPCAPQDSGEKGLELRAANPGAWGNRLSISFDSDGITEEHAKAFTERFGISWKELFNVTVTVAGTDGNPDVSERFRNLTTVDPSDGSNFPNRLDRVFENQSRFVRVETLDKAPETGEVLSGFDGDDGTYLQPEDYLGDESEKTGIFALNKVELFNLLCIPADRRLDPSTDRTGQELDSAVRLAAATYCADRRAFYIVDPPLSWAEKAESGQFSDIDPPNLGITGLSRLGGQIRDNCAVYFPNVQAEDLLDRGRPALFGPSAFVAGVIAATDVARGVWKAPAGVTAGLAGVSALEIKLTDDENGVLNPLGINCLREFPRVGPVVWGARTLSGSDVLASEYKYVSVRRTALSIEQSIQSGIGWAVFEPNDEPLWSSIRLEVSTFMNGLARQGAFFDYFVKCDATTTTAADIDNGIVNVLVGFAPVRPAEFVTVRIQQITASPD